MVEEEVIITAADTITKEGTSKITEAETKISIEEAAAKTLMQINLIKTEGTKLRNVDILKNVS